MVLTLAVVVMNTRVLGDEGQGTAALIQLGILLIVSVANFIGGGAVVYLTPRMTPRSLLLPAYVWAVLVAVAFYPVLLHSGLVPKAFVLHVCILGLLQSLFTFHLQVVVGKERLRKHNLIVSLQAFILAISLAIFMFGHEQRDISAFVSALYVSFATVYTLSVIAGFKHLRQPADEGFSGALKKMWFYGKYSQGGNILQLLNYRSNLYLLERLLENGRGAAGIFSIALYAAEAVWSFGKSLSLVQYARLANSTDTAYNKALTLRFLFLSLGASSVLCGALLLVPESLYLTVFGETVAGLYVAIALMVPGILANSGSVILAHHFSGTGRHRYNTIGSAAGWGAMLLTGLAIIPVYGLKGAAMAASIGYLAQLAVLARFFSMNDLNGFGDIRAAWRELPKEASALWKKFKEARSSRSHPGNAQR